MDFDEQVSSVIADVRNDSSDTTWLVCNSHIEAIALYCKKKWEIRALMIGHKVHVHNT